MKAIVQDQYGETDALRLAEIDPPAIGAGEVLVRVHAAGVDPGVWHLMTGQPYLVRVMGFGLLRPKDRVRGLDLAGRVEAVGAHVTRLRPGDEVFGTGNGSFAEYACAREDQLAPKPRNLTFAQAAAVPVSGTTALQAVRDVGQVRSGQKVLIIGAAGGVGTFAVQLARTSGAEVTAVCGPTKATLVRSIGATHVIDYTREDFADGTRHYDLILDTAGIRALSYVRRALTPQGKLVIIGGEGGNRWTGGFIERLLGAAILSAFSSQKLIGLSSKTSQEALQALREVIEAGHLTPVIDRTYPLAEAPAAIRYLTGGHASGKVVVTV